MYETECSYEDLKFIANELIRLDLFEEFCETIMLNIEYLLRHQIAPKFWKYFSAESDTENGFYQFQLGVYELHQEYEKFKQVLGRMQLMKHQMAKNNFQRFSDSLKFILLSQLPANFSKIVYSFYNLSFKVFANSYQDNGKNSSHY